MRKFKIICDPDTADARHFSVRNEYAGVRQGKISSEIGDGHNLRRIATVTPFENFIGCSLQEPSSGGAFMITALRDSVLLRFRVACFTPAGIKTTEPGPISLLFSSVSVIPLPERT